MKKLLIGTTAVVSLLMAALLVLPGWIDWTRHRAEIAAGLSDTLGHPVEIDGEVALTLLPSPHLSIRGLRVLAPVGAAYPNMARATAVEMDVRLLPLLGGHLDIERLRLVEPVLVVERLADGTSNWRGPGTAGTLARLAAEAAFRDVAIEDGTVIRHLSAAAVQRVTAISARLSAASLSGPVEATGRFEFARRAWIAELRSARLTGAGALPVQATLSLDGVPGTLQFAGLLGPELSAQGEVTASGPNLGATLNALAGATVLPPVPARPFAVHGALRTTADAGTDLTGIGFELGEVTGTGSLALGTGSPAGTTATLAIAHLDLDDWLGPRPWPLPQLDPGDAATALLAMVGDRAGHLDLSIEALETGGAALRQVRLGAGWGEGAVSVERLSAQLPGSSAVVLAGRLHAVEAAPRVDLRGEVTANDLRGLLRWLGLAPEGVPAERLRRLALTFALAGSPHDFQVTGFDATVDTSRVTGALAWRDRDRLGVGLRFALDRLDLDSYGVPPAWTSGRPSDLAAGAETWLAALTRLDANLDGRVGYLTLNGLTLQDIRLDASLINGALTLRRAAIGSVAGTALALTGTVGSVAPPGRLDLTVDASAASTEPLFRALQIVPPVPPDGLGAVSLSGRVQSEGPDGLRLGLTAGLAGGSVELGGTVTRPLADPAAGSDREFALAIRARHPNLAALARRLLPDTPPASVSGAVDLYARIAGSAQQFALDDLQGTIGAVPVAGRVQLDRRPARPELAVELRTGAIDLDGLLPAGRPAASRPTAWREAEIDLGGLYRVDGTLAFTASGIRYAGLHIAEPALRAELHDGVLTVSRLSGGLFDGTLGLSGRIEAGTPATVRVEADLVGARLDEALAATFGARGLSGTLDIGLTAETTGVSPAAWIRGLAGHGLIAVRDGTAAGIDLDALAASLAQPGATADRLRRAFATGRTGFAAFNAPFILDHGVARAATVRLAAAAGIGQGSASYDLAANRVEASLGFQVHRLPEAPPLEFRLSGAPAAPERSLDTGALPAYLARRAGPAAAGTGGSDADAAGAAAPLAPDAAPATAAPDAAEAH